MSKELNKTPAEQAVGDERVGTRNILEVYREN